MVTGEYDDVTRHRPPFSEIAGSLVAWFLRMPAVPATLVGRHYRGPGFRLVTNLCNLVNLGASETGNLVCEVLDESERALLWFAIHVGALPDFEADIMFEEGGEARSGAHDPPQEPGPGDTA